MSGPVVGQLPRSVAPGVAVADGVVAAGAVGRGQSGGVAVTLHPHTAELTLARPPAVPASLPATRGRLAQVTITSSRLGIGVL